MVGIDADKLKSFISGYTVAGSLIFPGDQPTRSASTLMMIGHVDMLVRRIRTDQLFIAGIAVTCADPIYSLQQPHRTHQVYLTMMNHYQPLFIDPLQVHFTINQCC